MRPLISVMAGRTKAEKSRIEKRMRAERTVIPIVCVLAVAAFIVIAAVFGKTGSGTLAKTTPEPTAEPTEYPFITIVGRMAEELEGEKVIGEDYADFSFRSPVDGSSVTAHVYLKSGLACIKTVRTLEKKSDEAVDPDDPFGDVYADESEKPGESDDLENDIASELVRIVSFVYSPADGEKALHDVKDALVKIRAGELQKTDIVFGAYIMSFDYSEADKLLTVICEPS
ncbi:MAG: hypothetical protein K6G56_02315 [Clostridiales bacterium]|nr:hypothetical protein [Clostridiales bacterium]